ncbi:ATPase [Pseudohalioglobus sediminis]|uniref:ATPase n=1 Tax=Pseudohalioglobus sediminis TaxID=2606449 RepID=A0A5B0WN88_9GAMM|nr:BadF/BadG/BcrA/BcrD ATPase family protein [Pseudohalioglobus sediminis]KAA1188452.1 ATPase [Pseudohalioglobus sediminis]
MSRDQLFLGIDGGGSKCKARLVDTRGELLGTGVAGPANAFQDACQTRVSIVEAARQALADAQLPADALGGLVVGAGLAGVNIPRCHHEMTAWQHPFAAFYLATDIHVACLGAHAGADGAVIVAGTGSVGYSLVNGVGTSFGAHGFPFGDKGSGAWLGLEALKAALLAMDELGPATTLLGAIESHLGTASLGIVDAMAGGSSRDYGALAPLVFTAAAAGDAVARGIVEEGAAYLDALARRLQRAGTGEFCLLGGLAVHITPWLSADVAARIRAPLGQPDEGAVRLALTAHRR